MEWYEVIAANFTYARSEATVNGPGEADDPNNNSKNIDYFIASSRENVPTYQDKYDKYRGRYTRLEFLIEVTKYRTNNFNFLHHSALELIYYTPTFIRVIW